MLDRKIAPSYKSIDSLNFIHPQTHFLNNGVKVNIISGGSQEIVKIDFIFNAGTYFQTKPLVAAFTNNLIKEGTNSYSAFEIAEGIDQYGAYLQTNLDFDKASITLFTLNSKLNDVMPYFKEAVLNPSFEQKEFEIYHTNAIEKFKISMEKVNYVARKTSMEQIFGNKNPYGTNASISDFENIKHEDVVNFHKQFYQLSNCEVIVSGKVSQECIQLLNNNFGSIKINSNPPNTNSHLQNDNQPNKIKIEKENSLQTAIRIGKQIPNKLHKDYFGLKILNTILGGYFGSRLMKNIREEKGYTYGISSGVVSLQNGGFFYISTEVGTQYTYETINEIYKEIELLKTKPIEEEELSTVKNYMLGNLLKSSDGPFNMAELFEGVHFYGLDYEYYNQYMHKINTIASEELMQLANTYFTNLKETIVGKMN